MKSYYFHGTPYDILLFSWKIFIKWMVYNGKSYKNE